MAGTVNKVIIIGHLGRDPETRNFNGGGKVVTMSVATGESWKDRTTGERKERTEWHRVAVFAEGAANFAEQYLRKGNKIYVEGQLETRKWDDNGVDRYSTEVVVRPYRGTLTSLESVKRDDGWGQHSEDDRGSSRGGGSSGGARGSSGGSGVGFGDDLDDDIPFITCDMAWEARVS